MSGICGFVGTARPGVIEAMLAAIAYRGDRTDTIALDGASLGYRWWEGRPGKSSGIHRDGSHAVKPGTKSIAGILPPGYLVEVSGTTCMFFGRKTDARSIDFTCTRTPERAN